MGKGTILEHLGDGKYKVQLKYDREAFDESITKLTIRLEELEADQELVEGAIAYGDS